MFYLRAAVLMSIIWKVLTFLIEEIAIQQQVSAYIRQEQQELL